MGLNSPVNHLPRNLGIHRLCHGTSLWASLFPTLPPLKACFAPLHEQLDALTEVLWGKHHVLVSRNRLNGTHRSSSNAVRRSESCIINTGVMAFFLVTLSSEMMAICPSTGMVIRGSPCLSSFIVIFSDAIVLDLVLQTAKPDRPFSLVQDWAIVCNERDS